MDSLAQTNGLAETYKVPGFHIQLEGKNGGGDRWFTDGALWVGVIREDFAADGNLASELETSATFESTVKRQGIECTLAARSAKYRCNSRTSSRDQSYACFASASDCHDAGSIW